MAPGEPSNMIKAERRLTLLEHVPENGLLPASDDWKEDVEEFFEGLERIRGKVLELESDELGLDLGAATDFIEEKGLRVCDFVILNELTAPELHRLTENMLSEQDFTTGHGGFYNELLDIAFVYRDKAWERVNGTVGTEALLVHELGHGTNEHDALTMIGLPETRQPSFWQPRIGFITSQVAFQNRRGDFPEEGFVERQAAEYRRKSGQYTGRAKRFRQTGVPDEYLHIARNGRDYTVSFEVYAAWAFELLYAMRPGLDRAMIESRKSAKGLVKFAKILNRLEPGLHAHMRNIPLGDQPFGEGLMKVMEIYEQKRIPGGIAPAFTLKSR